MANPANNSPQDKDQPSVSGLSDDDLKRAETEASTGGNHEPGQVYRPGGSAQQTPQPQSVPVTNDTSSLNTQENFNQPEPQPNNSTPQPAGGQTPDPSTQQTGSPNTSTQQPTQPAAPQANSTGQPGTQSVGSPPRGASGSRQPAGGPKVNPSAHPEQPAESAGSKRHWVLIGLAMLIALALAIAGAWAYQQYFAPTEVGTYLELV